MTRSCILAACLLLAASGLASAQSSPDQPDPLPPSVPAGPTDLDHYKCYFVEAPPQQIPMLLQDQFDLATKSVESIADVRLVRFCNPVQKNINGIVTKILKPTDHMAMYLLNPQPTTPRTVVISNQFGDQILALGNAEILAVPSGAVLPPATGGVPSLPPIPADMDHYKCYVASGHPIEATAILIDTFHSEKVQVLEPFLFCNPVQKTHPIGATPTSIQRPLDHLACYKITPTPFQGTIYFNNQLVSNTSATTSSSAAAVTPPSVAVGPADMLCAPSFKLRWSEVTAPTITTTSD